jgi:hypothetical protein
MDRDDRACEYLDSEEMWPPGDLLGSTPVSSPLLYMGADYGFTRGQL